MLHLLAILVALASRLVGASSHEAFELITRFPIDQSKVAGKKHLRAYRLLLPVNNEERGINTLSELLSRGVAINLTKLFAADSGLIEFSDYNLASWDTFVERYNAVNPTSQTTVLQVLLYCFGVDGRELIIKAATMDTSLRYRAFELQCLLEKRDPDDLLAAMRRVTPGPLFQLKRIFSWFQYVYNFNKEYPEHEKSIFARLDFQTDGLVEAVFSKVASSRFAGVAGQVLHDLILLWLNEGRSPAIVYHSLGLNEARLAGFNSPRYVVWEKYVGAYNDRYPKEKVSVMAVLALVSAPDRLVQLLEEANKSEKTESQAIELYFILYDRWINGGDFSKELESLNTLVKSVLVEAVFSEVTSVRFAGVAGKVLHDLILLWLNEGRSPAIVYHFLGLNEVQLAGFKSPRFAALETYVTAFNASKEEKESVMAVLASILKTGQLVKILQEADKSEKTKHLAIELYFVLLKRVADGRDLDTAYLETTSLENLISTEAVRSYLGEF